MKSIKQQLRRARLAVVALGLIGAMPSAFAAGTPTASIKANDAATTRLLFFTTYLPVVCAARV